MIGIVGAGVTGLALSHALEQAGAEHVVLEAAAEAGGAIRTQRLDGRVLEYGPQRTRLTPAVAALVEELDLHDRLLTVAAGLPLYIYHGGRLHRAPLSPGTFVQSGLLSARGKVRVLLEPLVSLPSRGGARHTGEGSNAGGPRASVVSRHRSDETVGDFLTRCFGHEVYERLLGPLFGGLYASDPRDMYVRHSLARALNDFGVTGSLLGALVKRGMRRRPVSPACSFRDGMATLPAALLARQAHRVRLATPVDAVRRRGRGFVLAAGRESYDVDRVVLTTPADATACLLREVAPEAAARLARLTYNPLAIVHLHADREGHGFGYQVALTEALSTRGVTWNASMFPGDGRAGVYTAFVGGARHAAVVGEPDQRIAALATAEFERVTGWEAEVLHVSRTRMPAWDRSWAELDGLALPERLHLCTNYVGRPGIPGRLTEARRLARVLAGGEADEQASAA